MCVSVSKDLRCVCVCLCLNILGVCVCVCLQDGRAEVVANDAGDRITPAVVAYRDNEQVFLS